MTIDNAVISKNLTMSTDPSNQHNDAVKVLKSTWTTISVTNYINELILQIVEIAEI